MKQIDNTLILKNNFSEFSKLENFIDIISEEFNIGHSFFSTIITVLSELVENAVVHGNKNNPDKSITISFTHSDGFLIFSVSDEGNGFDVESVRKDIESGEEGRGYGLFLSKTLSDKIEFENSGSTVKVMFDLASANLLLSSSRRTTFNELRKEIHKSLHEH